ncbi:MAG: DUF523 domain-containing protein [Treponema sp.]|nr:DUF523 domain-containing protein [Treponema sp.]
MKIMVSACLLGENCKYNGKNNFSQVLFDFVKNHDVIKICPEVTGGLSVPRECAEIVGGTVRTKTGISVDAQFRKGAAEVLKIALQEKPDLIILHSRSPSCGANEIYDGTFSGSKIPGMGICANLLKQHGFNIADSDDFISNIQKSENQSEGF